VRPLDITDRNEGGGRGDSTEQAHRKHIMDLKLEPQTREQFIGEQI
jgi:hypothetical protein